ncbi:MAG: signal recognition particle protein [Helicobacteraceae bacterium]|nr:signal recognition particle protein [Helicobacteraceae bacterium]
MFDTLTSSFKGIVNKIRFQDDEKALTRTLDELKKILLKNDVYHKVTREILLNVESECKKNGIGRDIFKKALENSLLGVFSGNYGFNFASKPPTIVLMVGLQGSGKTTSSAKLANYLKLKGKKVLLVACDLQRLAAIEQLRQLSSEIEVDFFSLDNKNSLEIANEAIKYSKDSTYDVVIIDTAGRLAINSELMKELKEIKENVKADETFYVLDSLSGQDAVRSAESFNKEIGLSGVILSKFDSDTKGGIALSVTKQIGVPIRFIGSGEKIPDLDIFLPDRIVGRLMGAGDVVGFIEKTTAVVDEKEAKRLTKKIRKGNFNFVDFLEQLESIKKMGSMKSLISMMPGLGAMGDALKNVDIDNSKEIKNIKAMVSSMTPKERENPSILNGSRKKRIANGCGLEVSDINRSLKQFESASKMAKQMSSPNGVKNIMNMIKGANLNKMR